MKTALKVIVVLLLVALTACATTTPTANNTLAFRVRGTSMYPTFIPGDVAVPDWCPYQDVRPGDICIYEARWSRTPVVHRVIVRAPNGWVMKGDNNRCCDPTLMTAANFICRTR